MQSRDEQKTTHDFAVGTFAKAASTGTNARSASASSSPTNTEQDEVDAELDLLLGASVFGSDTESLTRVLVTPSPRGVSWHRIGVTVGVLAVGTFVWMALHFGLRERAVHECAAAVEDLAQHMHTGSFDAAAQLLPVARALARDGGNETTLRDFFLRVEATLYRFHDASAERRIGVLAHLDANTEASSSDLTVAHALFASAARSSYRRARDPDETPSRLPVGSASRLSAATTMRTAIMRAR